jgi:di/tricarboxylate transporter
MGLSGFERQSYLSNLVANALVAGCGYLLFGGWRLFGQPHEEGQEVGGATSPGAAVSPRHWITLDTILLVVVGVVGFQAHVGMAAFAAAVVLTLAKVTDEKPVIATLPWSVILMVCGVTVLTSLLEKTGGIDLFTTLLARFATQRSVNGLIALVTGLISVYSSTSGVVLPAFLPSVPGLVAKLGGGDPLAIASSILIGGHLVDVSPLSPIGALCIAAAPLSSDRRLLFHQVLAWGLAMSVLGALGCYLVFP